MIELPNLLESSTTSSWEYNLDITRYPIKVVWVVDLGVEKIYIYIFYNADEQLSPCLVGKSLALQVELYNPFNDTVASGLLQYIYIVCVCIYYISYIIIIVVVIVVVIVIYQTDGYCRCICGWMG